MLRILLAFRCFFLILFSRRLPEEARALLPAPEAETPPPRDLPPSPAPVVDERKIAERGAVAMLALLQREGRLVDFLQESIESYPDAQIGAAARNIHRDCRKVLGEHVKLAPVMGEPEGSTVQVKEGFDASTVRLVGEVSGKPPFSGVLQHGGWRAVEIRLPLAGEGHDATVVAPAEVELGGAA